MFSSVDVTLPDNESTNTLSPLTGLQMMEELSGDKNPLHEDLAQARLFAKAHNKHLKEAEGQSSYYYSLNLIVKSAQELAAAQDRLYALQSERKLILECYAHNQQACADAFNEKLDSGMTYTIEGESTHYSVDINTFPFEKKVYLKRVQAEASDKLKNLTSFTEVIKTYSEDHDVRQLYEKNGVTDKPFLQGKLRVEKILSDMVQAIVNATETNDPRKDAKISMMIAKQLSIALTPYQAKTFELDMALHQNSRSTSIMLVQEDAVRASIQITLEYLLTHQPVKDNGAKKEAILRLCEMNKMNELSDSTRLRPMSKR